MKIINIKSQSVLANFIEDSCCENEICVTIDNSINSNNYVIIKVDKYYNSLKLEKTPASIDCLIIRKCFNSGYGITLVELKNIETGKRFEIENMKEKFNNTLNDFIKIKFKTYLDLEYRDIKFFFVSRQEIYKRDLGLKMEALINTNFNFNGKKIMISPQMPNPTIKNCY